MRLDVMSRARAGSVRNEALRGGAEHRDGLGDDLAHVADEQHEPRQQPLHQAGCVGSIAGARARLQIGVHGGRRAHQRRDVVGQDLGRDVDDQCLLRQTRDGFKVQAMLEPFEGLFDAPSLVVEVGSSPEGERILAPDDAQRLHQACPDLSNWAKSWRYDEPDVAVGQQIVEVFTPFLLGLLDQGLARKTISRHRDNLWTLGGELIRRRYDDKALARKNARDALQELVSSDEAPLAYPRISESEQDSLDATCRKLNRFLRDESAKR